MSRRWIIEFDYEADPETPAAEVRADLSDHLSASRGPFRFDADRVIFEHMDDAVSVRLRFDANIVEIETN